MSEQTFVKIHLSDVEILLWISENFDLPTALDVKSGEQSIH